MKLGPEDAPIITSAGVSHAYFKTEVGQPIGNYFLLIQDGVFKSQEELDAYPHFSNAKVGDFKFVDADGNGKMDLDDDRAIVGNYMPKFTYGFMSSFSYKGVDPHLICKEYKVIRFLICKDDILQIWKVMSIV